MDDRFSEAFLHRQHGVAGKRLRPYSLAAWWMLELIDSPLLYSEGRTATLADVQLAATICAAPDPRKVALRPSVADRLRGLLYRRNERYVRAQAQAFVDYLDDYASLPQFWRNVDGEGRPLTAPWILSRVVSLMRLNVPYAQAWLMPVGEVFWLDATARELEGGQLRFLYEGDDDDEPSALDDKTDAELYEIVKRDMGEEYAREWMADRRAQ